MSREKLRSLPSNALEELRAGSPSPGTIFDTDSDVSISSEEEVGSEEDSEQRVRARKTQEIWDPNLLWNELMVRIILINTKSDTLS